MVISMNSDKWIANLVLAIGVAVPGWTQQAHVGNLTAHADSGKKLYRRYCVGCHGPLGDGNGENAPWIDPKPRDFVSATFKCRSTPTGTLPTDQDLYNSVSRGFTNSNMPHWDSLPPQNRIDLVAISRHSRHAGKAKEQASSSRFHRNQLSHHTASRTVQNCFRKWNAGNATGNKAVEMDHRLLH